MGWISTLTANNDLIHRLKNVDNLGSRIESAIQQLSGEGGPIHIGSTGLTAIETHHADTGIAVMVGGPDEGRVLGGFVHYNQDDPEVMLIKRLAEKFGYRLVKMPRRG